MLKVIARRIDQFISSQSASGVLLALSALVALLLSNSPWSFYYQQFLQIPGVVKLGADWLLLSKPMLIWINDLWMAVFFFLVGLEIKRELLNGELASLKQAMLPAVAALGGMVVPALIYAAINGATRWFCAGGVFPWPPTLRLPWGFWCCWVAACRPRSRCF